MNSQYLLKIGILSLGFGALLIGTEKAALAQFQTNPQEPIGYQKSEQDPSQGLFGGGFNPTSLIHNVNFSRSRTGADFAEDTQNSLNKAATEFKRQQQLQLQSQPNAVPSNSVTNPSSAQ
ncbi:MAG: hypothetical protein VKJ02_03960 [Snowella sp.]|nr:hypothetical protein [Snowella sp.]